MKRRIWNLLKRAFRRSYLQDVDAVLLAAYERRLIDTLALHEMDAAFKYGHSIIRKRATYAGETRGVFAGAAVVVLALMAGACATAEGKLALGRGAGAAGPDQAVVVSFMRFDDSASAHLYLAYKGVPEAEIMAAIQRARAKVAEERAAAEAARAAAAAKESK